MFRLGVRSGFGKVKFSAVRRAPSKRNSPLIAAPFLGASNGPCVFGHKYYSAKSTSEVITCKAAVCRGAEEKVKVEEIKVEAPKSSEVRVKMLYASLCHTDVLCVQGALGPKFPRVVGHEGVGVVESVGDGVKSFKEGDVVIPTILGECKVCENCTSGKTNVCPTFPMSFEGLMMDGTSRLTSASGGGRQMLYHVFSCSTWSEYAVIDENYAVKVDPRIPLSHASLLSCGFSTGLGAPWKEASVERGSTVAVFGLGAVGLGALEGARLQGAARIIGVDNNKLKGSKGKAFGMTDFINPGDGESVPDQILELTGGMGVDYCIECTGAAPLAQQALESTKPGTGTTILLGVGAKPTMDIVYHTILNGRTMKGSTFGGIKIKSELPIAIDNCINEGTPLDQLLTHEISLDEVHKAFDLLRQPDCVKVLIKI